ncbi:CHASE4 domain-containing protein [Moorella sp. Hama-1]|uniref:CHASE4 domain-containing protein n=1 Tax=Moorella sp. Hama-1 TaxID=2138101 RepID=UPI000D659844|nr:CHASE4 domain-containing protein [Moorella sp. Hama-1]BCV21597.1 hypothetical protein hamaS1_16660 [Moorella sp. Hama-1]
MSLKTKVLLVFCAVFALLALIFFAVSYVITGNIAGKLENESIQGNVEVALQALERELTALDKSAADWAIWDDTYSFVEDRNREYLKKNLGNNTFKILGFNYAVFLNTRGEIVYARGYDPEAGKEIPLPPGIVFAAHNQTGAIKVCW